jgi:polyhydroxybutyrate depolymerase
MKNLFVFLCLIFLPFLSNSQQTISGTIMHDNILREYFLYVPASYDGNTAVPLVFCFHGYGSNASMNMTYTNFRGIADTAGFIVVHPQGTLLQGTSHWNVGGWTLGSTIDDVGFTNLLLDSISNAYNINSSRVYSTGMSNGGYMSFLLACQSSDKFAAVASVTGSMTPQTYNACNPLHPTPILQIHGDADATVPYTGDPTWTKSIDDVMSYWVNHNNCNTTPTITNMPDINTGDNSTVEYYVYDGGDNGTTAEHFKVLGGDHDWPGVWGNMDINASIEVWKFFAKYDINGLMSTEELINKSPLFKIYPNPTSSLMTIENDFSSASKYEISSITGKIVQRGVINSNSQQLDLTDLASDIYYISINNQTQKIILNK